MRTVVVALMIAIWGLPLGAAVFQLLAASLDAESWMALAALPHKTGQVALSLFIGTGSTLIAVALAVILALSQPVRSFLRNWLAAFLAMPHIAFAVGFGFLIMPAGLLTRLLGFQSPPQWVTTQDPLGLTLISALVLKEVPFLLFLMLAVLEREDFAGVLKGHSCIAASLGHGSRSIAYRIVLPQLLRQVLWPIVIVWVYSSTVIDMAIVIGPTQPPPFQIVVWRDLADAEAAHNSRGLAGALLLVCVLALAASALALLYRLVQPLIRCFVVRGPQRQRLSAWPAGFVSAFVVVIYALVFVVIILIAGSARWPYPLVLPESFDSKALASLFSNSAALANSLMLALASTAISLGLTAGWLELVPRRFDKWMTGAVLAALMLPPVALASGQYVALLRTGLGGSAAGVFLAQFTPVLAYVFISLRGPMRDFDPRFRAIASSLRANHLRFFFRIKAPLLAGVLASAAAIGFAVSIGQYVPVQLVGGGSVPTLATEAVTLASGGSRPLLAAHALALMAFPALAFVLASFLARLRHA